MKKLIGNIMSVALEVIMWITLIACIIGGVIIAKESRSNPIAGLVIGTLAGIVINILVWGVISLVIEIRDYVKEIAESETEIIDYVKKITKKDDAATKNEAADTKADTKNANLNMDSFLR